MAFQIPFDVGQRFYVDRGRSMSVDTPNGWLTVLGEGRVNAETFCLFEADVDAADGRFTEDALIEAGTYKRVEDWTRKELAKFARPDNHSQPWGFSKEVAEDLNERIKHLRSSEILHHNIGNRDIANECWEVMQAIVMDQPLTPDQRYISDTEMTYYKVRNDDDEADSTPSKASPSRLRR